MTEEQAIPIETHRLGDADAQGVQRQAGCIVSEITGKPPAIQPVVVCEFIEACRVASDLARRHPGHTFAVFKPAVTYSLEAVAPPPVVEESA